MLVGCNSTVGLTLALPDEPSVLFKQKTASPPLHIGYLFTKQGTCNIVKLLITGQHLWL